MNSVREERAFWAHQLHANLLNSIGAAIVQSQVCERAVKFSLPGSLEELLRLKRMLYELEGSTRALVLSASNQTSRGLGDEVRRRIHKFKRQFPGIGIHLEIRGSEDRIPRRVVSATADILDEALSNAAKHGLPKNIEVGLFLEGGSILLRIRDDGRGFDVRRGIGQDEGIPSSRHCGLVIMRERAEAIGGKLAISSAIGRGTQLTLHVSLSSTSIPGTAARGESRPAGTRSA